MRVMIKKNDWEFDLNFKCHAELSLHWQGKSVIDKGRENDLIPNRQTSDSRMGVFALEHKYIDDDKVARSK